METDRGVPALLDSTERLALATALGDTPETVITVHLLRRGLCRALVLGPLAQPRAAIVPATADATEPAAFGDDPQAIWTLLQALSGWRCVNVPLAVGPPLAELIAAATGRRPRRNEDVYHALARPAAAYPHPAVRRLTPEDAPLLEAATPTLGTPGWNWGGATTMLREGPAAGAVVGNRLVSVAYTAAVSDRHADIGVATLPQERGKGLATAAAALVGAASRASGRTPVWSTGEDNRASLKIARNLGFAEVGRRVYVIPA